jgi:tetratricopeptide (TPR) repeat protein
MEATQQFTRQEFQRLLDVSDQQLNYWEKLRLISPRKAGPGKSYDFRDLITLKAAKQLIETGIPASRLRRSLVALNQKLSEVKSPLTELRISSNGKDVIVERAGAQLEPISGQFILNFETRELGSKIRVMPERSAEDWFAMALQYDGGDPATRPQAMSAYQRTVALDPNHVEALINLGMLAYDAGQLAEAAQSFRQAVELQPENGIAQFNLGSVLEELGEFEQARQHLRLAVRHEPYHADARYNLAFVCEKVGALVEAREHWAAYVKLEPSGTWADYARKRLGNR